MQNQTQITWLTNLYNLLTQVVTKLICHHVSKCELQRVYERFNKVRRHRLQVFEFKLNHSTTCLIVSQAFCLRYNIFFLICKIFYVNSIDIMSLLQNTIKLIFLCRAKNTLILIVAGHRVCRFPFGQNKDWVLNYLLH